LVHTNFKGREKLAASVQKPVILLSIQNKELVWSKTSVVLKLRKQLGREGTYSLVRI
jgi:hypothetical protein